MRTMKLALMVLFGLSGCTEINKIYESYADYDEDGYTSDEDCNDADAASFPGAEEICDGLDNDCDDVIDFGNDTDADGFDECEDCNDGDDTINPGMPDVCDGLDNDCSGHIDDYPVDGIDYCVDIDEDGEGSRGGIYNACKSDWPAWAVEDLALCLDCEDGDPTINTSAEEVCDGLDNDCNDEVDNECSAPDTGDTDDTGN